MLSEEALILYMALGACGMLALGAMELLWPSRSRRMRPRRRPRAETSRAPRRQGRPSSAIPAEVEPAPARVEVAESARPLSPVEECFALYEQERFLEAAAATTDALARTEETLDRARLWSLLGLAKQALGDDEGARFAFEEAIAIAPLAERATSARHLASLALHVGHALLEEAKAAGPEKTERVDALRSAIEWIERGLAAMPGDAALTEALAEAREAFWATYDEVIRALMQRKQFSEARRFLDEVVADPECPPPRRSVFQELLVTTLSAEVGQLSAEAIRHIQAEREADAAAALERAEGLLASLADSELSLKRRQELERRLWWGYTKLGLAHLEAGAVDAAFEPLFHALRFQSVGQERHEETREILARAFASIVEVQETEIVRLIDAGESQAAGVQAEKLWAFLRRGTEQGLSEDELADAFSRALDLFNRLGQKRP